MQTMGSSYRSLAVWLRGLADRENVASRVNPELSSASRIA
jgi:hypothetical protein